MTADDCNSTLLIGIVYTKKRNIAISFANKKLIYTTKKTICSYIPWKSKLKYPYNTANLNYIHGRHTENQLYQHLYSMGFIVNTTNGSKNSYDLHIINPENDQELLV